MQKIGFITSTISEEQYVSSLQDKYRPVFAELRLRGLEGSLVAYDSEEPVDWGQYSMLVPSPALEYAHNYPALLSWLTRLEERQQEVLQNPIPVIRWNSHKSYLIALQQLGEIWIFQQSKVSRLDIYQGVRVPRTRLIEVGSSLEEVRRAVETLAVANAEIVVKPAVGASGKGTCKINTSKGFQSNIEALVGKTDIIIQVISPRSCLDSALKQHF